MGTLDVRSDLVRRVPEERADVGFNAGHVPVGRGRVPPVPATVPRRNMARRFRLSSSSYSSSSSSSSSSSALRNRSNRKYKTSQQLRSTNYHHHHNNKHQYFYYKTAAQPNSHLPSGNNNNNKNNKSLHSRRRQKMTTQPSGKTSGSRKSHRQPAGKADRKVDIRQRLEPTEVQITMTVPSATLSAILPFLPLTAKSQSGSDTVSAAASSLVSGLEIVGLGLKESDPTNTTMVLTLRDHHNYHQPEETEEGEGEDEKDEKDKEEEEEGVKRLAVDLQGVLLSRPKRSFSRRRMSYGMNGRIRAQMLAHRLSISYRHVQPCSYKDRYYCMNGGTCVFVGALDIKTCR